METINRFVAGFATAAAFAGATAAGVQQPAAPDQGREATMSPPAIGKGSYASVNGYCPNAQLAIFPGGDHFVLFTSPDQVLGSLVPFLDASARAEERGTQVSNQLLE